MKHKFLLTLVICLVAAGVWYFLFRAHPSAQPTESKGLPASEAEQQPTSAAAKSNPTPSRPQQTATTSAAQSTPQPPAAAPAPAANVPEELLYTTQFTSTNALAPQTILENMRTAIRNYGSTFGGNPVGTNPEIARALDGENPKQIKFLDPDSGIRMNGKGELVDPWGTPLFFHQRASFDFESFRPISS